MSIYYPRSYQFFGYLCTVFEKDVPIAVNPISALLPKKGFRESFRLIQTGVIPGKKRDRSNDRFLSIVRREE